MYRADQKLNPQLQIAFAEQLADLLESGLTLKQSLTLMPKSNVRFQIICTRISLLINRGALLSEAISAEGAKLEYLLTFFIQRGEQSGTIVQSLRDYVSFLTNRTVWSKELSKRSFYPIMVTLAALFSLLCMCCFILPTMAGLFSDSGVPLPWTMKLGLKFGEILKGYYLPLLLVIFGLGWFTYRSRLKLFNFLNSKTRLLKNILAPFLLCSFLQNLAILLHSGLSINEAVQLQKELYKNSSIELSLEQMNHKLRQGVDLSTIIQSELALPVHLLQIISNASSSGNLERGISRAALLLEKELQVKLQLILQWFEPVMTLLTGLIVAISVALMFYPLTKILGSLG